MKTNITHLLYAVGFLSIMSFRILDEKTEFIKVLGNCEMCKARIEKALQKQGIMKADWSIRTKIATITYEDSQVKIADIHKAISDVGHDTEQSKADDRVYRKLPGCCQYDRAP